MEFVKKYLSYIGLTLLTVAEFISIFLLNHFTRYYLEVCFIFKAFLSRFIGLFLASLIGPLLVMILGVLWLGVVIVITYISAGTMSYLGKINILKYVYLASGAIVSVYTFINAWKNAAVYFKWVGNLGVYLFIILQLITLIAVAGYIALAVLAPSKCEEITGDLQKKS